MMTGTPNVSNLPFAYRLLTLFFLLLFAIYDYRHHKVRNAALLAFLFGVFFHYRLLSASHHGRPFFHMSARFRRFLYRTHTLLAVSMITDGGIGGGDIKLAALLGIVMGLPLLFTGHVYSISGRHHTFGAKNPDKKGTDNTPSFYPLSFPWQPISPAAIILIQAACKFLFHGFTCCYVFWVPIAD